MKWYGAAASLAAAVALAACSPDSAPLSPAAAPLKPTLAASGVAGATYTTNNPYVDGLGTCNNGNPDATDPTINCNIYDRKSYVWLTGGPTVSGLEDGTYFFAVLVPGGQNNDVNDGQNSPTFGGDVNTNLNLSDEWDAYTNRTFVVVDHKVVSYTGTHDKYNLGTAGDPDFLIRLIPYSNTTNNGGEYDMAICQIDPATYDPSTEETAATAADCKYDNFKVREEEPPPPEPDNLVVDVKITADATNAIGEEHVFDVTATVAGGTKPYSVKITPSVAPAPGTYSSTCTGVAFSSNNNSFACTITINSTTAGAFVANALLEVSDAGTPQQTGSDNTATGTGAEGPATKTYVAATLQWSKVSDYPGGPLAGATFKIERIADRFGTPISPSDPVITGIVDCVANPCAGTDTDPAGGAFKVEGLQFGTWRITETDAPPFYTKAAGYQDVAITDLNSPTGTAAIAFVNTLNWIGETATGAGFPWAATRKAPLNWFMYSPWTTTGAFVGLNPGPVNLIAGQTFVAGQIVGTQQATTRSITITLTNAAFRFAPLSNNVKINPMSCTTNQNYVPPGGFSVKRTVSSALNTITVTGLPSALCYGVHVDVQRSPLP